MNGLSFFRRTNDRHTVNLASYHDPRSITWSWVLSFSTFKPGEGRIWPLFWFDFLGRGFAARIPGVGFLCWQTQEKMPRPCALTQQEPGK